MASRIIGSKSISLFYFLVGYVILQFVWWSYHIIDLHEQLHHNSEVVAKKRLMIVGEGVVFFVILILGILKIRRSFKREIQLIQQQKNFVASVTHELKSPLASVKLNLQTIEKRDLTEFKLKQVVGMAIQDTDRLTYLIDNILLASAVEQQSFRLSKEEVNLKELVELFVQPLIYTDLKRIVKVDVPSNLGIRADKMAMASILVNLFENAVKYSSDDSKIEILGYLSNDRPVLEFRDEGVGVANHHKLMVFERFFRVGDEQTRKTKGTGLGLYIVQQLMNQHGGTISVQDNSPKGSVFTLTF